MKKVLLIHNFYKNYGGEDSVVEDETLFLKKYVELDTLFFQNTGSIIKDSFNVVSTNRTNLISLKKLKNKIQEFRPDIVYIHNLWFSASIGLLDYLEKVDIPVVLKIHNLKLFCANGLNYRDGHTCNECSIKNKDSAITYSCYKDSKILTSISNNFGDRLFEKINSYQNIKKIIVLSPFHIEYFISMGIDKNKIVLVNNGIEIQPQYNHKPSRFNTIICPGRISEEKGSADLIEAFNLEKRNFNLIFFGTGPLLEKLKNENENPNIKFMGFLNKFKIFEYYLNSRAVIFPTRLYEGQGMVPVEASIYGLPTVSPKLGGMVQLYPNENPFMYEAFSIEDLGSKISLLESDNLVDLQGKRNRDHTIKNFEKQKTSEKLVNLLVSECG